jgi:type IV secretory pathway TrbD component
MTKDQRKTLIWALFTGLIAVSVTVVVEQTQMFGMWLGIHIHIWYILMVVGVPDPTFRYLVYERHGVQVERALKDWDEWIALWK